MKRAPLAAAHLAAALVAAVLGLAWSGSQAHAEPDPMATLVVRYISTLASDEQTNYTAQRATLEAIADLRTPAARRRLEDLLHQYGRVDRRRAVELLGALVRHGRKPDVDKVVRWVENAQDLLLIELLPEVLGRIERDASRRYVRTELLNKATSAIKAQVIRAMGASNDLACVMPLMRILQDDTLRVRVEALLALGALRDPRARVPIELFLRNNDARIRAVSADALGRMANRASTPALIRALDDPDAQVIESAAAALGKVEDPTSIPALIAGLAKYQTDNLRLADAFSDALSAISGKGIAQDPELWTRWWDAVKDRPLVKANEKPGTKSVPGARYYGFPVRSSKVLFILDVSRSMGWNERLEMAQAELIRTLETLPPTTRFNVIAYSDKVKPWRSKLAKARSGAIKSASTFIRGQKPDNGTNTHAALRAGFRDPDVDTIFLLSDGYPSWGVVTDPELIRVDVQNWNRFRRMRIHCIALMAGAPPPAFAGREDPARARAFLKQLAGQNAGWFHDVR